MSLLEKAKEYTTKKTAGAATEEEIELALAWVNDEVTLYQVARACGKKSGTGNIYIRLAIALKAHLKSQK